MATAEKRSNKTAQAQEVTGPVLLDDIIITEQLPLRPARPRDPQAENHALRVLARQMVGNPDAMLKSLVQMARRLCEAGTAGVSLLDTQPDGAVIFRWVALAGAWEGHEGGTTARSFSACGTCLDRNALQLYLYPGRYFTFYNQTPPIIVEALVIPLVVEKRLLGTIWILSHDAEQRFDGEDARIMSTIADFTAAALHLSSLSGENARLYQESRSLLHQREAHYQRIVENASEGIWTVDVRGKTTFVNQRAAQVLGYSAQEMTGRPVLDFVFPEDVPEVRRNLADCADGRRVACDLRLSRKDRTTLCALLTACPIRGEQTENQGMLLMFTDITARKQAEAALRESERLLTADLAAMTRLQEVSRQLVHDGDLTALLQEIVDTAIELTGADMGNLQFFEPTSDTLRIVASRGFKRPFLDFFKEVHDGEGASCGLASQKRQRIIIEDVASSPVFVGTPALEVMLVAGARACQSTPLLSRSGQLVGVMSTHYRTPHRFKDRDFKVVDLLARQAADWIERIRAVEMQRTLEREVLEATTLEQQRIGRELHDTTTQELTALGLLADRLIAARKEESPLESQIATKIRDGLKRVLGQVRAISHGLIRVEVDGEGLMAALAELTEQTEGLHGVACTFDCPDPVYLADNQVATQLYNITREAVANALKHAQARRIEISLEGDDQSLTLRVRDDGIGFGNAPVDAKGMGLKIMRYRAGLIDAHLSISPAGPGGTAVTCTWK